MKIIRLLCFALTLAMPGSALSVKSAIQSHTAATSENLSSALLESLRNGEGMRFFGSGPVLSAVMMEAGGKFGAENVSDAAAQLFGRRWQLTEVAGAAVRTAKPYIEFDGEAKRFAGDGGCNRISGDFEIEGANLEFSRVISTRRACLDREVQQVETNFLNALEQVTSFQVQDNVLRLYAGGSAILTFRADAGGAGGTASEARVTGTVTYLQRIALPQGAVVEVKLLDVSRANARAVTIAKQVIKPAGRQVPFAFELRYDPRRLKERRRYVVQARITVSGRLRFINTEAYPVIMHGHPDTVEVIVKPVRR